MSTNSVPFAVFGPGSLYVQRNDNAGPNTPINIGYAQEFSYDEAAENKELYGTDKYPLVVAQGTIKATGKMKAATVSGLALNSVFTGQSFAAGQSLLKERESHPIPTTPYQVVIAPPSSGTFAKDWGVLFAATLYPLQRVASSPATGQYSVDETTGTYTFAAADTGLSVLITYCYSVTGSGQTITVQNTAIGTTPSFELFYSTSLYGKVYTVHMFACVSTKLTRAHKLTDFMMPEIDFSFFANSVGNVYELSYPEVS